MYYMWMWEELNNQEREELVQDIVKRNDCVDALTCLTMSFIDLTDEQRAVLEPLALAQNMIKMQRQSRVFEQ